MAPKPLPEGAPEPPLVRLPHATIEPSAVSAAKTLPGPFCRPLVPGYPRLEEITRGGYEGGAGGEGGIGLVGGVEGGVGGSVWGAVSAVRVCRSQEETMTKPVPEGG